MFIPPYIPLLKSLNVSRMEVEKSGEIKIPLALLNLLLQIALAQVDFNEDSYLDANPDVRAAVERGDVESGLMHFIGYGYFEGRRGGMAVVDERWYLGKYSDVRAAVEIGTIRSAADHFHAVGGGEGRSPSAAEEENASQWKKVLGPG